MVEQAEASGKLPTEGKAAQYSFSYDKRFLFVQWLYSPDDRYLLAYNITDHSVEPIARLEGWWTPSPVSDCIILFGQTQKEAETGSTPSKHKTIIIDSQGNRYWFQIEKEQWQPDWGISRFAWSPDGLQIAFNFAPNRLTNEGVYIVQIDGSDIRSLFPNSEGEYFEVEEMAWSPVGDQLAIVARYNNDKTNKISKGMFIIDVQTGKRSLVVEKIQLGAYWSFDGQYLYFDAIGKSDGIGRCQQLDMLTKEIIEVDRSLCTIFAHGGIKH